MPSLEQGGLMPEPLYSQITGVILVGGKSRRMGQDKAFLPLQGRPLLEPVLELFRSRFREILLAGDRGERFAAYNLPVVPDIFPGSSLGGIHAALAASNTESIFVAPCDLPFPSAELLDHICNIPVGPDAIIPVSPQGYEPLYGLYTKKSIEPARGLLEKGEFRIIDLYSMVKTTFITGDDLEALTAGNPAFLNINTPEEYSRLSR